MTTTHNKNVPNRANALLHETSPYLLQHAYNPVDWMPWGEAALERARLEDKPVFLSVGYSTCYWCHVMEREVFEDEQIAALMNEHFVCIKVDREERPDIDQVYMLAVQLTSGRGGWPMSVFLTPPAGEGGQAGGLDRQGLRPFWAGTYVPPRPMHGVASFPQVLTSLHEMWLTQRAKVMDRARRVAEAVETHAQGQESSEDDAMPEREAMLTVAARSASALMQQYDPQHGGFSGERGPKFPTVCHVAYLLKVFDNNGMLTLWQAIAHTLERMACGGLFDQVGGGFHRYSVDEQWLVPHFEKMLYDQGQLLSLYAKGAAIAEQRGESERAALFRRVIAETVNYLQREMVDASGALWSAQDAEVDAVEGGSYVWTREQVREALGSDAQSVRMAEALYGMDEGPNFEDPHPPTDTVAQPVNVLFQSGMMSAVARRLGVSMEELERQRQTINARLLAVRDARKQPMTDDKVLAAWNGLAIRGLADAGRLLGEASYVAMAGRCARAVVQHMTRVEGESEGARERSVLRVMRGGRVKQSGFLEDYAGMVDGLLALSLALESGGDATGASWALQTAREIEAAQRKRFADPAGGYFETQAGDGSLFVRPRGGYDGATPTGLSVAMHNLVTLASMTGERSFGDRAVADLASAVQADGEASMGLLHAQHAALRMIERGWLERSEGDVWMSARRVGARVVLTVDWPTGRHVDEEGLRVQPGRLVRGTPVVSRSLGEGLEEVSLWEGRCVYELELDAGELALVVGYRLCSESSCDAERERVVRVMEPVA